jgi:hypothetical protein
MNRLNQVGIFANGESLPQVRHLFITTNVVGSDSQDARVSLALTRTTFGGTSLSLATLKNFC